MAAGGPPVRPIYRFMATGLGASMWFWVCRNPEKFCSCSSRLMDGTHRSSTGQRRTVCTTQSDESFA
ncbi:hypothetical protein N657DRAFT_641703 [Parathielavia appendiculata]|uniref:Uncharacterized protein n=1 Tax=Parathielavia appendiculata TaxID=2587402 RepID=A0AAN6U754_9PEZI|nr:hypothetical protein N657DRAFT_641703 [Parathielavia appendiculata]